jgi:hypothetical protein
MCYTDSPTVALLMSVGKSLTRRQSITKNSYIVSNEAGQLQD